MEKAPLTPTTVERARDVAMLSRITLNSSRAMSLIDSVGAASPSQVLVVPGQKAELQGDAFFIIPRSIFLHHSISSQNSIQAFASRPQVLSMTVKWKPGESRLPQLSGETPQKEGQVVHLQSEPNSLTSSFHQLSSEFPSIRDSRKIELFWDLFPRRHPGTGSYTASALTVGILCREWVTLIRIAMLQVFLNLLKFDVDNSC
jgi:hypothetical protein